MNIWVRCNMYEQDNEPIKNAPRLSLVEVCFLLLSKYSAHYSQWPIPGIPRPWETKWDILICQRLPNDRQLTNM